ncbi:MAG: hypothetical protein KC547_15365 [Anaerolineae bacterium]|nr:hypothetical protein [Anaerolineae bacterium]
MDGVVLLVIILVLIVVGLASYSPPKQPEQRPAAQAKPSTQNVSRSAAADKAKSEQQQETSGDPVTTVLAAARTKLPQIPDAQELFSGTSADFRRKLSLVLGPEYAQSIAQLTAQQLEAVRKKLEIGQRLMLLLEKAGAARTAIPAIAMAEIDALKQILALRHEAERQGRDRPEELVLVNGIISKWIADLLNEGSPNPLTDAADVTRLLVRGYAAREQTAQCFLDDVENEMLKGTTPSQIPVAEIYKKHYGALPGDMAEARRNGHNGQNAG